jgi:hypothetical protein
VHDEDTPLSRPTDPAHLFWVPASMHPEISPSDFRKFLQEHASRAAKDHTPPESGSGSPVIPTAATFAGAASGPQSSYPFAARSGAAGPTPPQSPIDLVSRSTSIARRGSTLRRQYRPENDNDDSDGGRAGASSASVVRGGSARRGGPPPLSLEDLHKLEQLAEEASKSQDPTQLRSVLRRTLSLSTTPSGEWTGRHCAAGPETHCVPLAALDQVDAVPAAEAEDAPLIVPRPGQILRRAARTKIRKASLSGENGGVRPPGRRRGAGSTGPEEIAAAAAGAQQQPLTDMAAVARALMERRSSKESEQSSGDDDGTSGSSSRPISDEATESIVDAYSRDSFISEASQRTSVTSLADSLQDGSGSGSGSGDSATSPHTAKRVEGRTDSRSPSPPVTPTQASLKSSRSGTDYFDEQREAALKQAQLQQQEQASQREARPAPALQPLDESLRLSLSGAPVTESPAHSPDDEPSPSERERAYPAIRPVAVSHVPPVPSFEKARTAPQPPPAAAPALPAPVYAPPAQQSTKREQPLQQPPAAVKPTASRESLPQAASRPGKEKKSGFASWFGIGKEDDEAEKQAKARKRERKEREAMEQEQREQREREKEKEREKEREREKEKDSSSFLGALFGSKKKGGDDAALNQQQMGMRPADSHITAGSLLDRSSGGRGPNANYYRYPIHIERAVYRLSHIKLANPRRPLYEQVLISNLM